MFPVVDAYDENIIYTEMKTEFLHDNVCTIQGVVCVPIASTI